MRSLLPRRGVARDAAWLLGGQLTVLAVTLAATPIQLDRMGSERYGVVVLTAATLAILGFVDLGAGVAVTRAVPWHRARGDAERARRLAAAGACLAFGLGALGALGLVAASNPLVDAFRLSDDVRPDALSALRLGACALPFLLLNNVLAGIGRAAGMFRTAAAAIVFLGVALNVVWAAVAGRADDVQLVAAALVGIASLSSVGWLVVIRLRAPGQLFPLAPSLNAAREIAWFGGRSFGGQAGMVFAQQADKLTLAALLPVAVLPTYSIPYAVAVRITLVSSAVANALLPRLSATASRGRSDEVVRLGLRAVRVVALAVGVVAFGAIFGGRAFLELWLEDGFARDAAGPLIALSIGYGAIATGGVGGLLLDATGRPGVAGAIGAGGAALAVGLATAGAAILDTTLAAAIGMGIGLSATGLALLEAARRLVLRAPAAPLLRSVAAPWATLGLAGGAAFAATQAVAAPAAVTLGVVGAALVATAAPQFGTARDDSSRMAKSGDIGSDA